MTKTAAIQDTATRETLAKIAGVASMTKDQLTDAKDSAAGDYAAYSLWCKKPDRHQGDRDDRAWAIRAQRASAAADLWLAAEARLEVLMFGAHA